MVRTHSTHAQRVNCSWPRTAAKLPSPHGVITLQSNYVIQLPSYSNLAMTFHRDWSD